MVAIESCLDFAAYWTAAAVAMFVAAVVVVAVVMIYCSLDYQRCFAVAVASVAVAAACDKPPRHPLPLAQTLSVEINEGSVEGERRRRRGGGRVEEEEDRRKRGGGGEKKGRRIVGSQGGNNSKIIKK